MRLSRLVATISFLLWIIPVTVEAQTQMTASSTIRVEAVGYDPDPGSAVLSDKFNVQIGENALLTRTFLARHIRTSGATEYGPNRIVADFFYSAPFRRLFTRSLSLTEVDDPVDIRCARVPGVYPNIVYKNARLEDWQLQCIFGASNYGDNGLSAYHSALTFGNGDGRRYQGYACISGASGRDGLTPRGEVRKADDLRCHNLFLSDGAVILGHETDPRDRPEVILRIIGNVVIEGNVIINGDLHVNGTISADGFVINK